MLRGTTNSVPFLLKTLQRLPIFLLRLLTWLTDAVCDHAPSCFSYVLSHLPITVHPTASWQGDSERVSAPQTLTFWLLGFCIHPLCLLFISLTPISVLRFLLGFFSFFPLVVPSFLIYVLLRCVPPPPPIAACVYPIITLSILYSLWFFNRLLFLLDWKLRRRRDHVFLSHHFTTIKGPAHKGI